jgi:hypothetical protein
MTTVVRHSGALLAIVTLCTVTTRDTSAQQAPLRFITGERLTYDARAGMASGRAEMWVEGPVEIRGVSALLLRFTFNAKVGPFGVSDETSSWIDPVKMATLRFEKRERHLLARHAEEVDVDGPGQTWRAADGRTGSTASTAPLDELSFIYALRSLPLPADAAVQLDRHFDADRNPTIVRFIRHDTITTPAGTFATREVEMRVRDTRHYQGEGVIRFSFSDDICRRPVRIVSTIPGAGRVVLTLASASPAPAECAGRVLASSTR